MKKLNVEQMQDVVTTWSEQTKGKYPSVLESIARLNRDVLGLEAAIENTESPQTVNHKNAKGEIGDILFTLCCLANSRQRKPLVTMISPIHLYNEETFCLCLYRKIAEISSTILTLPEDAKKDDSLPEIDQLNIIIGQMFYLLQELCNLCAFDPMECFGIVMTKKEMFEKV